MYLNSFYNAQFNCSVADEFGGFLDNISDKDFLWFSHNNRAQMMTKAIQSQFSTEYKQGLLLVLMAGVLWSTVGLGIRMIQDATVWQILLYRSVSLSGLLAGVIYLRSGVSPVAAISTPTLQVCLLLRLTLEEFLRSKIHQLQTLCYCLRQHHF